MAPVQYRLFDQHAEDPEPIFALYEAVHGATGAGRLRRRWAWEFLHYPEPGGARIYLAEESGRAVGMTARMSCPLRIAGEARQAYFATNSMVLPAFRGRGIIRDLYDRAAGAGDVQLSRATLATMHRLLRRMGYQAVLPDTYLVCLLRPLAYAASRLLGSRRPRPTEAEHAEEFGGFVRLDRFGAEFEATGHPLIGGFSDGVVKSAAFLNWRYVDIPLRRYHVFARRLEGRIVSVVVLRCEGLAGWIVDARWDQSVPDEPRTALGFAKAYGRALGVPTVELWTNGAALRRAAHDQRFIERSRSDSLSYLSDDPAFRDVDWSRVHFVQGDRDVEYLEAPAAQRGRTGGPVDVP